MLSRSVFYSKLHLIQVVWKREEGRVIHGQSGKGFQKVGVDLPRKRVEIEDLQKGEN